MGSKTPAQIQEYYSGKLDEWRFDPSKFAQDNFGFRASRQQEKAFLDMGNIARARCELHFDGKKMNLFRQQFATKRGVSIRAGQGTGKTTFAAISLMWFLCCFPNANITVTSTTASQLLDGLWKEIKCLMEKSGELASAGTQSYINSVLEWHPMKIGVKRPGERLEDPTWWAKARTSSATDNSEDKAQSLAGRHSDHQLFIFDEASGIPDAVFTRLLGTQTGYNNFSLVIFNPIKTTGEAAKSHRDNKSIWITHAWNAEECEFVENIEMQRTRWGVDTDAYRVWVKGEFPTGDGDSLIPFDWIQAAIDRTINPSKYDPAKVGIDLGLGGDQSAFILRHGCKVYEPSIFDSKSSTEIADWASRKIADLELPDKGIPDFVYIDRGGPGADAYKLISSYCRGINVTGVHFGEDARDKQRFVRKREEMWWNMREAFESGNISIPNNKRLVEELCSVRFRQTEDKRIRLQPKTEMSKSPDLADALALTFFEKDANFAAPRIKQKVDAYEQQSDEDALMRSFDRSWMSS